MKETKQLPSWHLFHVTLPMYCVSLCNVTGWSAVSEQCLFEFWQCCQESLVNFVGFQTVKFLSVGSNALTDFISLLKWGDHKEKCLCALGWGVTQWSLGVQSDHLVGLFRYDIVWEREVGKSSNTLAAQVGWGDGLQTSAEFLLKNVLLYNAGANNIFCFFWR